MHKHVFNFFRDDNVITTLQSGFVPGDSTVNQQIDIYIEDLTLVVISYEMYETASFINFIWNDHECKILFIIWLF